ncbi:MAG: hypothetical protein ACOX3R_13390 [Desulfitobacteriia bacterium]|jgi:hypothetical protein
MDIYGHNIIEQLFGRCYDMDKENKNKHSKEGEAMATPLSKKEETIKEKLDRISAKASVLTGNDNMIELDPKNPQHKEWFEDDKCKGN